VIVIHHGTLLYDGGLPGLVQRFSPHKTIVVEFEEGAAAEQSEATVRRLIGKDGEIVSTTAVGMTVRVPKAETARVTGALLAALPVADLTVEDPPIEEVIERVFSSGRSEAIVPAEAQPAEAVA
jgi:ABC-2 type transport system ATP-binding protein